MSVGLVTMPALSEQVSAGNLVSEVKNKGKQGEISSDDKRIEIRGGGRNV